MQSPSTPNFRSQFFKRPCGLLASIALVSLSSPAESAISLTGAAVIGAKNFAGSANVANGSLGLLVVDWNGDGTVGLAPGSSGALDSSYDPGVTEGRAGLEIGDYFGDDIVLARFSSGGVGPNGGVFTVNLPSLVISPYFGKGFAIVWFDQIQTATSPANAPEGTHYGIVSGSDWILPVVDDGGYVFSGSDSGGPASFYQVNLTLNQPAAVGLRTSEGSGLTAASFTVVPEPSSALIAGIGMLCHLCLRRRR